MARLKVMTDSSAPARDHPPVAGDGRPSTVTPTTSLVHTGQNYDYELNQVFFDDLELRPPDHYLGAAGQTAAETIGQVIIAVDRVLGEVEPDAVLILGDTNSCLAAIPAKRRKIPVFHMEAGNRCFDMRVPEEINRRIVDHVADINLPYSAISRDYLLREGLPPDRVITTGSPMFEVLHHFMPKIERSEVLTRLGLEPDGYFLVSCHREENVDSDAELRRVRRDPEQPRPDDGQAGDRDHPPAHPKADRSRSAWCSIRSSSSTSRSASPTTWRSNCTQRRRCPTAGRSPRRHRFSTCARSTSARRTSGPRGWKRRR